MNPEDIRLAVYEGFATTGQAPAIDDLAATTGTSAGAIRAALEELAARRHLVLDGDSRVVMAHPFSSIPLGFAVMGQRTLWWGGCAWDSFALPHLLVDEPDVLVATRCPACHAAHSWVVDRSEPPAGAQVAHFLVPVERMWDDVVATCRNQRIFCSNACVANWLQRTGHQRGYVLDLPTLWRLASGWYAGRLERGYVRREPSSAKAYFRDVGLEGSFWGL
jgi:hypothetical protein